MRALQIFVLMLLVLMTSAPVVHAGNIVLYNTGVSVTGTLLGSGATDSHYTLTTNPASGGTSTAYVVTKPNAAWQVNTSTSQWINPVTAGSSYPQTVVNGEYDYVTTFSLAGLDPTTASITGMLAADDKITDILINGHSTHATNSNTYAYGSFHAFTIGSLYSADFLAGNNTLTFEVQNTANGPSGLQAQLAGTASVIPEPAAFIPFVIGALGLMAMIVYRRRLVY